MSENWELEIIEIFLNYKLMLIEWALNIIGDYWRVFKEKL
jgi:hypothetical protein